MSDMRGARPSPWHAMTGEQNVVQRQETKYKNLETSLQLPLVPQPAEIFGYFRARFPLVRQIQPSCRLPLRQ